MKYDAVIVGAGHNGLAAAVRLVQKHWRVAVVEEKDAPGGAVKTREVTLPGFRHDVAAMNLSMFAGSPFIQAHKHALLRNRLAFAPVEDCFASVFADGSHLGVSKTPETTVARIAAVSQKDAEAWKAMLARFGTDAPYIFALFGSAMPSRGAMGAVWKALRERGAGWLYETLKLLLASPRDFLDANFESDKVKAMMAAWGLHLDFAPDIAGGALFPYLESMANQAFGMVIGQGGADTIVKAMVRSIEERRGEVRLDAFDALSVVRHADHSDVDAACRKLARSLGDARILTAAVAPPEGDETSIDSRLICVAREALAYADGLADFAFAMQASALAPSLSAERRN